AAVPAPAGRPDLLQRREPRGHVRGRQYDDRRPGARADRGEGRPVRVVRVDRGRRRPALALAMGKTLVVTNDFPPRRGGIQSFVHALACRLPAGSVAVYAPAWEGAAEFDAR